MFVDLIQTMFAICSYCVFHMISCPDSKSKERMTGGVIGALTSLSRQQTAWNIKGNLVLIEMMMQLLHPARFLFNVFLGKLLGAGDIAVCEGGIHAAVYDSRK